MLKSYLYAHKQALKEKKEKEKYQQLMYSKFLNAIETSGFTNKEIINRYKTMFARIDEMLAKKEIEINRYRYEQNGWYFSIVYKKNRIVDYIIKEENMDISSLQINIRPIYKDSYYAIEQLIFKKQEDGSWEIKDLVYQDINDYYNMRDSDILNIYYYQEKELIEEKKYSNGTLIKNQTRTLTKNR